MKQAKGVDLARGVAAWAGWDLDEAQCRRLERYAEWLVQEALPAGLVGPGEANRIWSRHIADSLAFAVGWQESPQELVDVGSGAGLPGVPLAVLWPRSLVRLTDRSTTRVDHLRRVKALMGLTNVVAEVAEADRLGGAMAVVARAVLPPERALETAARLLEPGGRAVLGWTRAATPEMAARPDISLRRVEVPKQVLDAHPVLLIMAARG